MIEGGDDGANDRHHRRGGRDPEALRGECERDSGVIDDVGDVGLEPGAAAGVVHGATVVGVLGGQDPAFVG